jgi:hypothetical protein
MRDVCEVQKCYESLFSFRLGILITKPMKVFSTHATRTPGGEKKQTTVEHGSTQMREDIRK